jgi:hypothetical protein
MNRAKILEFAERYRLAVLATVSAWNIPEAAVVGIATDRGCRLSVNQFSC